ncbi:MAG TPA: rRNA maturation RNase YbeY, partial [Candidatus Polarisedimenticolia bacterium]|nr:rRNA maturation RNase YbeY [Candidatus Polarisedimenticolia bacterium]
EAVVQVSGDAPPLTRADAARLLRSLGRRLHVPHRSVGLLFAGDTTARAYNRRYRGKDRATDVLSFPSGEPEHLGDIVIASGVARRQAGRRGHSAASEARVLILHGFLHLLGYDHETDDGEMETLERTLRAEIPRLSGGRR